MLILFLLLLVYVDVDVVQGNVVFEVHHKYGSRAKGIMAPLSVLRAHDSRRHGRMLAGLDFHLGGDGSPTNAAYVNNLSLSLLLLHSIDSSNKSMGRGNY